MEIQHDSKRIVIMGVKLCSFNCKGLNVSKMKHITELLSVCDILMLQETLLLRSQICSINQYFTQHHSCGVSGINENVLLICQLYGGCSFLYKKIFRPLNYLY